MPRLAGNALLALTLVFCLLQQPGTPTSRLSSPGNPAEAFETAETLREQGNAVSLRRAEQLYRLSALGWRSAADLPAESEAWSRLAEIRSSLGDLRGARDAFELAIVRFRMLGRHDREVETLNSLGRVLRLIGKLDQAEDAYVQALRIAREITFLPGEAVALNNLGMLRYHTGEIDEALPAFRNALAIWLRLGEKTRAATTLGNIGSANLLAGQVDDAAHFFRRSLALARSGGDRSAEATALTELGWCKYLQKDYSKAIDFLRDAIEIRNIIGDRLGEAGALDRLGSAQRELGLLEQARQSYGAALSILIESGSLSGQAHTLCNLCQLQLISRQTTSAKQSCNRALSLFRATGDANGEAHALHLEARRLAQEGLLDEAARASELAVDLLDNLWTHAEGHALRASYLETRYTYYESHISILMELSKAKLDRGYDFRALKASERARSRNLLALLLSNTDRGKTLGYAKKSNEHRLLTETLSRSQALEIEDIRGSLLDPNTLLIVYSVGEKSSYLWWISRDDFGSQRLPGRDSLARMIFKARTLLVDPRSEPVQSLLTLEALGGLLIKPALRRGLYRRLILVPDGPLYYLPFGALSIDSQRDRSADSAAAIVDVWEPLLSHYDVTVVPSLSILQLLREGRGSWNKTIAIFADPVFSSNDPRLTRTISSANNAHRSQKPPIPKSAQDLQRSAQLFNLSSWKRLPASRIEALGITSLIASKDQFLALDFAARREAVLKEPLANYRILHFATHSAFNEKSPDLSGIVLSMVDEQGQPIDGLLRASDVLKLKLSADLVVLSGCRTALGRETRSEGLVGFSQAFLIAGARSLLVSLWDVDDRATSILMRHFYHNLLRRKQSPAEALKEAQKSLRAEEGYEAPYYWAAFVLLGEGNPEMLSTSRLNKGLEKGSFLE